MNDKVHLLLIDDEKNYLLVLETLLTEAGYAVTALNDPETALAFLEESEVDIVITDMKMPRISGREVLERVKKNWPHIPVLIMTAFGSIESAVEAMRYGAFNYITKPFSPSVLVARIKANLAQYDRLKGGVGCAQIQMGEIRIQEDSRRVFVEEREVTLKNKEYELLLFLMSNPDIVFSKEALYERIWGCDALGGNATVAVHINRLREKTEKTPSEPRHIQTVWGAGYRFRP